MAKKKNVAEPEMEETVLFGEETENTAETEDEAKVEAETSDDVKAQYEAKIAELESKLAEMNDMYLRARADFENNKKRNATLSARSYADGRNDAIEKILPIGDNFDRALEAAKDNEAVRQGLELIRKQFEKTLSDLGIEEIEAEGKPFDPNFHEAVMQQPAAEGEEHGTVKTVLIKGYKAGDKVIRHSMVIVID